MHPSHLFLTFVVFVFGAAVGSFLNVCIYRLPRGLTVNKPSRSFCPKCRNFIVWYDNIPVFSYVLLGGRCRRCGERISWVYPAVEAVTALLFTATFWKLFVVDHGLIGPVILMLLLEAMLIVAAAVDFEFRIIPEEISVFGLAAGLVASALVPELHVGPMPHQTFRSLTGMMPLDGLIASLIGIFVGGGVVLLAVVAGYFIFKKEAMGGGDVVLMALVGSFLGWKAGILIFFVAPFLGIIYGIIMVFVSGDHYMPYGPWLASATVIYIMFRDWFAGHLDEYVGLIVSLFKLIF